MQPNRSGGHSMFCFVQQIMLLCFSKHCSVSFFWFNSQLETKALYCMVQPKCYFHGIASLELRPSATCFINSTPKSRNSNFISRCGRYSLSIFHLHQETRDRLSVSHTHNPRLRVLFINHRSYRRLLSRHWRLSTFRTGRSGFSWYAR